MLLGVLVVTGYRGDTLGRPQQGNRMKVFHPIWREAFRSEARPPTGGPGPLRQAGRGSHPRPERFPVTADFLILHSSLHRNVVTGYRGDTLGLPQKRLAFAGLLR